MPSERDKAPGRQFRLMNVLTVRTHFLGQERLSQDASLYSFFNSNKIFWINQNYQAMQFSLFRAFCLVLTTTQSFVHLLLLVVNTGIYSGNEGLAVVYKSDAFLTRKAKEVRKNKSGTHL